MGETRGDNSCGNESFKEIWVECKTTGTIGEKKLGCRWKENKLGKVVFQSRNKILEMKDNLNR